MGDSEISTILVIMVVLVLMIVYSLKSRTKWDLKIKFKATVENPRGRVEKLSPKESVEGAYTVLRGSVRAPEGLPEENPEGALTMPRCTVYAPIPKRFEL